MLLLLIVCGVLLAIAIALTVMWGGERLAEAELASQRTGVRRQAIVGRVSFEGTIAYLVFGAMPFAFASTALYLSVLVFAALAVVQGSFVAAFAARLSLALPLMTRRNWAETLMPFLLAVVLFPLAVILAVGAIVTFALPRLLPWFLAVRASRWGVITGRVLLAAAVLAALPSFIGAVVSIASR